VQRATDANPVGVTGPAGALDPNSPDYIAQLIAKDAVRTLYVTQTIETCDDRAYNCKVKLCSIEGCNKPHEARGWCNTHYSRWLRTRTPDLTQARLSERPAWNCTVCGEWKEAEQYSPIKGTTRRRNECRKCVSRYQAAGRARRRDADPEGTRARKRADSKKNYARLRANRIKAQFGLTTDGYNAMVVAQGGLCAICRRPERANGSNGERPRQLSIDHDHVTGKVRGLLCQKCNIAIGQLDDNPERLDAAAAYLRQHHTP
jgi:hypothetical protein